ncbi:hypothetical protein KY342_05070 [Candidatus Woesearchaeota archaeon]|nr:hypothetical protein [Candidatus Woesearchaeota archaeon]
MKERLEQIVERLKNVIMFVPELTIYQISDFLIIPVRNWLIPRAVKREFPWLSCRDYNFEIMCKPVKKYYHNNLFLFRFVCKSYSSGICTKYQKKS